MKFSTPADVQHDLAERAKRADLHLRFDRVALRFIDTLRTRLTEVVPETDVVLFTITAPIRLPAKTVAIIAVVVRDSLPGARIREVVHGNDVRLRWIEGAQAHMPKAIGFVHNPESDAELLLDLAERRLAEIDGLQRRRGET